VSFSFPTKLASIALSNDEHPGYTFIQPN